MEKLIIRVLVGAIVVALGVIVVLNTDNSIVQDATVDVPARNITIYKTPACSCCGAYATYVESLGYKVDLQLVDDIDVVKERLGVPYDLQSCHTSEIDGYVVEGHVPIEAIEKMLSERPDIAGIALPGMPSGSPGMPGEKEDFIVYVINHDGTRGDVFVTL